MGECDLLWPPPPGAWSVGPRHLHHHALCILGARATGHQGPRQVHLQQRGVHVAAEVRS